jgi:hypothetical protein
MNYSADGGVTWQVSDIRLDTDTAGAAGSQYPQIAVSGSSVYVAWADDRNGNSDVYLNYSTDGGVNWQASDIRLDTDTAGSALSQYPQIAVFGSSVYVVWYDNRGGSDDIYLNYSTDGGVNWQVSDIRLDTDTAGDADSQVPQIAVSGSSVYAVWQDYRDGCWDIYMNYSTDSGAAWQASDVRLDSDVFLAGSSQYPQIAVSGSNVYAVWEDYRNGSADIYFNFSTDGGVNWQAEDIRLDTTPPGTTDSRYPEIAVSGSNIYVVWEDHRSISPDIYLNYSTNGGVTWQSSDIRLDTDDPGMSDSYEPKIAVSGSSIYVVWDDSRNGSSDIYLNYSIDGGATWQGSDIRLDTDTAGADNSWFPRLAVSGTGVYVAWEDTRDGQRDIYLNYSTDSGATWQVSDTRLDTNTAGTSDSRYPHVAVSGANVYTVWYDYRNGNPDIYLNYSADGGSTWQVSDMRLDTDTAGAAESYSPEIAVSGSGVYVVWYDNRDGNDDIYLNYSIDGGATWQVSDIRLDTDTAGAADSQYPQITILDSCVYVVWQDYRDGDWDIYMNYSTDNGTTWHASDIRLDTDAAGAAESSRPQVAVSAAGVFTVWHDYRNSEYDIYFNSLK